MVSASDAASRPAVTVLSADVQRTSIETMASAMQPEAKLSKLILETLEPHGWFFKVHGGPFQQAGVPDVVGCVRGRFVAMEVKRPGREGTLSTLQRRTIEAIQGHGGVVEMITTPHQAMQLVVRAHHHSAVAAAWLQDRSSHLSPSSAVRAFVDDLVVGLMSGDHLAAQARGELEDLIVRLSGRRP